MFCTILFFGIDSCDDRSLCICHGPRLCFPRAGQHQLCLPLLTTTCKALSSPHLHEWHRCSCCQLPLFPKPGEYGAQVLRLALVNQLDCRRKAVWLCTKEVDLPTRVHSDP